MSNRLLYVIGELHTGGSERQLYYLLRAVDRERYNPAVAVWNYCEQDTHVPLIEALGVPLYSFPGSSSRAAKLAALHDLIRQLQPGVVHSWSFYTNFAAYWAARRTPAIPVGSIRSDFLWALKECGSVLGRLSARWPSNQICNSFSAAENVRTSTSFFVPAKLSVVRNGIDFEHFPSFPVPTNDPVHILGIGYLLPVKRWERLLAAIHKLKQKGFDFLVQVAGNGPLRPELEGKAITLGIADRVQFLGHVTDVSSQLAQAAFVVHTADSEGCPNAITEAMACGRAVVATDAGDIASLIENGTTGYVVPRDDTEALVDRMGRLINDLNLCKMMGKAGRAKAEREFRLDRLVEETLAVYRSAGWQDSCVL